MKNEKSTVLIWNINNNAWNNDFLLNVYIDIIFWREFFDFAGKFLCRVPYGQALGKAIRKKKKKTVAECWILSTRQRLYSFFYLISLPSAGSGNSAKKGCWHLSVHAHHFLSHLSQSSTPARTAASTRARRRQRLPAPPHTPGPPPSLSPPRAARCPRPRLPPPPSHAAGPCNTRIFELGT